MAREFTRSDRVGRQLLKELSDLLRHELKDPRLGMVTLQEARVNRDLSYAKVYFTLFDGSDRKQQTRLLNDSAAFLRREIGRRMQMRVTPQLEFIFDESIERAADLSALIDRAAGQAEKE